MYSEINNTVFSRAVDFGAFFTFGFGEDVFVLKGLFM